MTSEEARPPSSPGRLLLAVALLAALVFLWPGESPAAPSPPPAPPVPAQAAPPAPPAPPKSQVETPKGDPPAQAPTPATTGAIVGTALRLDGVPAPGAKVRASPDGDQKKRVVAIAGEDGSFRFDALAPGRWMVVIGGGGYATRRDRGAPDVEAQVVAGGEVRVEVRGQALGEVVGRVLDPDGKPVAKADLEVLCLCFLDADSSVWTLKGVSGDDGAFAVKGVTPGGSVSLTVRAPGFGTWSKWIPEPEPGGKVVVDVALERGVDIEILLVAADDGTPVQAANVWVTDASNGKLYEGPQGDSYPPDKEGWVLVTGLRPRPVKLQIDAKGFVSLPDTRLEFPAQGRTFMFRLVRALSISGRVLRADGTPAPRVRVNAGPEKGEDPMALFHRMARNSDETEDDGAFRIDGLSEGRYRVGAGDNPYETLVSIAAEAGASDVLLKLPAPSGRTKANRTRLTVRAVDSEGKPVPQARYLTGNMVDGMLTGAGGGAIRDEDTVDIRPDETGFVEIWDARDANGVRLPLGYVFQVVPEDAPDPFLVTLPAEKTIEGKVVGPEGKPVEGAEVQVVTRSPEMRDPYFSTKLVSAHSGAGGKFRVVGLGSGRVRLRATADGFVGKPVDVDVGAREVVLPVEAEVVCDLRILDPAGKPMEDVNVVASVGPEELHFDSPRANTDAAGRVRLRGLVPGKTYSLHVNPPESRRDLHTLRRQDWTPVSGDLRFE